MKFLQKLGFSAVFLFLCSLGGCTTSTPVEEADFFSVGNWNRYDREIRDTEQQVDQEYAKLEETSSRIAERRRILGTLREEERLLKEEMLRTTANLDERYEEFLQLSRGNKTNQNEYIKKLELIKAVQEEVNCFVALEGYTQEELTRAAETFQSVKQITGPQAFSDPAVFVDISERLEKTGQCRNVELS